MVMVQVVDGGDPGPLGSLQMRAGPNHVLSADDGPGVAVRVTLVPVANVDGHEIVPCRSPSSHSESPSRGGGVTVTRPLALTPEP